VNSDVRLLADENFPLPVVSWLRQAGFDVFFVRTETPGASDSDLLHFAEREHRIVLTLDKDFWQIALQRKPPLSASGVVLFRVHPATARNLLSLVKAFAAAPHNWRAHISRLSAEDIQMLPSIGP
jgi:predicted nuclease of predicted toxin-antitoxin system